MDMSIGISAKRLTLLQGNAVLYSLLFLILLYTKSCTSNSIDDTLQPQAHEYFGENILHELDSVSYDQSHLTNDSNITIPEHVIQSSCRAFIDNYADVAANYTNCAIRHARPLGFCMNCVQQYLNAKSVYENIMEDETRDAKGTTCKEILQQSDKVQIVVKTHIFVESLWTDCSCNNCFSNLTAKGGPSLSHDTMVFFNKSNVTLECFANNTRGFIPHYLKNQTFVNESVCHVCSNDYEDLNQFFIKLDEHFDRKVCMDIVDMMNRTRSFWSQDFQCRKAKGDMGAVIALSSFFALLPIVFYIGNRIYGAKIEKNIIKQKRLRDVAASSSLAHS